MIACLTTLGYCFTWHFVSIKLAKVALNWDKQACEIVRASNLNAISLCFVCKIATVIRTMKIWNIHRRINEIWLANVTNLTNAVTIKIQNKLKFLRKQVAKQID